MDMLIIQNLFLKEDDRLLDVIYKAGGYKNNAYPLGGYLLGFL